MVKKSTQAILWCIINTFFLLSFLSPMMILTVNFVMIPVLILFMRLELRGFILAYVVSIGLAFALTGSYGLYLLALSLFFLPPPVVMGTLYKKQAPARTAIIGGTITLLAEFLLVLIISYAAGFRPMQRMREIVQESFDSLPDLVKTSIDQAQLNLAIDYFIQLTPLLLIAASVYYVIITHGVGRLLIWMSGMSAPKLSPMREWMLPKSLVFYFILVTLAEMFIPVDSNSTIAMFVWNLLPLLTVAFAIQAIGFFFYISHAKQWPPVLPVLGIVAVIIVMPLIYLYSMIGVLDVVLPLRKRIGSR